MDEGRNRIGVSSAGGMRPGYDDFAPAGGRTPRPALWSAASSLLPPVSDGKIRLAIWDFLPHLHSGTDGDKRNVSLRCPDAVHALCGSSDILWRPHGGPEIAARPCGGPGTGGEGLTEDCWTGEKEAVAESMKMEIESAFSRTECVSLSID